MLKIFDSHTHYDDRRYGTSDERDSLLKSLFESSVSGFIAIGCSVERSRMAVELADRYSENVWAAVGIHPGDSYSLPQNAYSELAQMIKHPKVKAVGEIGLDYHYAPSKGDTVESMKLKQKFAFKAQLEIAGNLPVIVHSREATEDTLKILEGYKRKPLSTLMHCFSGSAETARELVSKGFLLGFGGPVTYKNAKKTAEAVKAVPLSRIMLETDCPYLSPEPFRGTVNHSGNLWNIAAKIAEIKEVSAEDVINASNENIENFFGIEIPKG